MARTIFYLGDQQNIDVSIPIPINIELTSLGLEKLVITNFNGEFVQSVEYNSNPILVNEGDIFEINVGEVKTIVLNLKF